MFYQHGMTALHYAANAGHLAIVELLLAASAELNAVDEVREFSEYISAHYCLSLLFCFYDHAYCFDSLF